MSVNAKQLNNKIGEIGARAGEITAWTDERIILVSPYLVSVIFSQFWCSIFCVIISRPWYYS